MKKVLIPEGGAKPLAPYSPGIQLNGDLVFSAGQIGLQGSTMVEGGVTEQTRQAMENLKKVLEAGGAGFDSVVKITIFMTTMDDYGAINEVYGEYFDDAPPARSAVAVYQLPAGALVEIEAIAYVKK